MIIIIAITIRQFRVVPSQLYVGYFSSDRSHMVSSGKAPPPWPLVKGIKSDSVMNLPLYFDMSYDDPNMGKVLNRDDFLKWCNYR